MMKKLLKNLFPNLFNPPPSENTMPVQLPSANNLTIGLSSSSITTSNSGSTYSSGMWIGGTFLGNVTGTASIVTSWGSTSYGLTYSATVNKAHEEKKALYQLVDLLLMLQGIKINVEEFTNLSEGERLAYLRDLKLGQVLDGPK